MKRLSLVLTLIGGALTLIPQHLLAGKDLAEVNEFIVRTQNPDALQRFVEDNGLQIGPLIRYPNPSEEVIEMFGCYRIVTIPETLQSVRNSMVDQLKCLPGVEYVEPNLWIQIEPDIEQEYSFQQPFDMADTFPSPYIPDDPMFSQQWDKTLTQTDWAWNVSTGEGVTIAIIDSGVDTDHEDIEANLEPGFNFPDNNTDVEDAFGHGTRATGVTGAKIDNNKGIAGTAGNSSIMPLKIVSSSGNIDVSDVAQAITYAADHGAKVINISLGGSGSPPPVKSAVDYAWGKGLFLAAAAGNDNEDASDFYPAAYAKVMSVGATTSSDTRWGFSNYGQSVDIWAPGDRVLTTFIGGIYIDGFSGTSLASPQIAGLAALIRSAHPTWTNQQVWDKIIESADVISIDKGQVFRMNSRMALDVVNVDEEPVTEVDWLALFPIGQRIVLRYQNIPDGFHAEVFDASGRKVDEIHAVGTSGKITWGADHSPGVYFIKACSGDLLKVQKAIIVR